MRRVCALLCVAAAIALVLVWVGRPTAAAGNVRRASSSGASASASTAGISDANPAAQAAVAAGPVAILRYVQPANAEQLTQQLPAPARQISYVEVNRSLIEGKSSPFWQSPGKGRFELPLPDGTRMPILIDSSEMLGANRFTSIGRVEGNPQSRVVLAYADGFLSGSIDTADHSYALRPATNELTQFYEVDATLLPACGGVRHAPPVTKTVAATAARRARLTTDSAANSAPATAAAASGSAPEIHVMMLYTQAVKPTMSGAARVSALQSEFDASMARVNNNLVASKINARVKLAKVAETQYNETLSAADMVQDEALTALQNPKDGKMDEIHALRDQSGADIVCLAVNRSDTASIGLAYVLDTPLPADSFTTEANADHAFAVVQYSTVAGTEVVPHEFGHIFGCAHARGDSGATGTKDGAYTYSYGYRFFGNDGRQYHDIMAYSPGTGLGYYSNPAVTAPFPVSAPLGIPAGQPGEADCAQTIARDAFEVSQYRMVAQGAFTGSLVNVSTRAYVGTGDQVMIAGFVIDGTQPKRVLVRAAGPALSAYNVADYLSNPTLELSNGATNDDWGRQTSGAAAGDVATAASQVGAFPFATGSADAALLVTLNPGSYTAIVRGASGASGSSLVEVYDVDHAGNRIVNLSTRGYADAGREMFGGFVVQGEAGTTKRILIRVLGPTLANYGVSGPMYDPMMGLHDGTGQLLLTNDDWSSGTTAGSASAANDFNPLVKTYTETQIAATGFAPSNRREPCVMVDLPPGNYSVVAEPFQALDRTPPQPAEPGVAIVEVYEIAK